MAACRAASAHAGSVHVFDNLHINPSPHRPTAQGPSRLLDQGSAVALVEALSTLVSHNSKGCAAALTTYDCRSDRAASKRCLVSGTIMDDSASTFSCMHEGCSHFLVAAVLQPERMGR